jgi:holo-[acyl-carrier protein] synthase
MHAPSPVAPNHHQQLVGVGVDIVDVADFERNSLDSNPRFYSRCFTEAEISYCRSRATPARHFAARFAAKEAAVKAAATITTLLPWQFEVTRSASGIPSLRLREGIDAAQQSLLDGHRAYVSLAHGEQLATAVVVLCKESD